MRILGEFNEVVPEVAHSRPHISGQDGQYTVFVEGAAVGETEQMSTALFMWATAHFTFNQRTRRGQKNTNWFMRQYILEGVCVDHSPDGSVMSAIMDLWKM